MATSLIGRMGVVIGLTTILGGCAPGLLYTDVTAPLTRNMRDTPRSTAAGRSSSKVIREPVSGAGVSVEWASRAIGDIARRYDLAEVYYADLRTVSYALGIWRQQQVIVHGSSRLGGRGDVPAEGVDSPEAAHGADPAGAAP